MSIEDTQANADATENKVVRGVLKNGLVMVSEQMHSAPVVALQVWVNVGSADEEKRLAGAAHLHEHMLFKGTPSRAVGEIARTVEASGGEINAWTSFDQTAYHVVLAADELETGLDVLSDAVRRSLFDAEELAREMEVVVEEINRAEDAPSRRLSRALFELAYREHTYRLPVLGTADSVRGMTRDDLVGFFNRYYRPDNITLVAVGDFEQAKLNDLVQQYFGDWQVEGALQKDDRPVEPVQDSARAKILREDVKERRFACAWHLPALDHADIPAIDLLSVLLGHGDSSRLYQSLRRDKQIVNDVYAYAYTPREPGMMMAGAGLKDEFDIGKSIEEILAEVYTFRHLEISEEELQRTRTIILSDSAYQKETVEGEARKLGFYQVVAGDYRFEQTYKDKLLSLNTSDILEVAKKYLLATPSMVLQLPQEDAPEVDEAFLDEAIARAFARQPKEVQSAESSAGSVEKPKMKTKLSIAPGPLPESLKSDDDGVYSFKLDNGIRVLAKSEASPVVAYRAVFAGGQRPENSQTQGIGYLHSSLWGRATENLSAEEFSSTVAGLGGSISAFSGRNSMGMRAGFLAENAHSGLELFADAMYRAKFDEADLQRERAVALNRIKKRGDNGAAVAYDRFAQLLYGQHPYGQLSLGTPQSVNGLTLDAINAHGDSFTAPGGLVLGAVGGLDIHRTFDDLNSYFSGVKARGEAPGPELEKKLTALADKAGVRFGQEPVHLPMDKQQSHLIIGGLGTTIHDADRYALEVLTTVLSGQSGRLFMDLRDKRSMAYSVSCSSLEGIETGHVMVYMGTSPEKLVEAKQGILEHLDRVTDELISHKELQRASRYLCGTHAIDLQRCGARAMLMSLGSLYGLGYDHYRSYTQRIQAVTREDVKRVAQRFLSPDGLLEVVAGPTTIADPAEHG